jgi:hypothetical protein
MAQAARLWPLSAEAQDQTQVSLCENFGGQSVTGRVFSPSISVVPCQYHSTNAPFLSLSTCCSYQKDKRSKIVDLPKSNAPSEIGEHGIENKF